MRLFDDVETVYKPQQLILFIIEASDNTQGKELDAINRQLRCEISKWQEKSERDLKIAILAFSNSCEWMYAEPLPPKDITFRNMHSGGQNCNLGEALCELNKKLSKNEFLQGMNQPPAITLISSGKATDDFESAIILLNKNKWFSTALKVAIAVGNNIDKSVLFRFTGHYETVVPFSVDKNPIGWLDRWISVIPSLWMDDTFEEYIQFWYDSDALYWDEVTYSMVLLFIINTSESMQGTKICAVNTAIREVLPELKDTGGSDVYMKVSCLTFSNECQWMYPSPIAAESFQWSNVEANGDERNLGKALLELDEKLGWYVAGCRYAPIIFLMMDGLPTDDYKTELEQLKQNPYFAQAIKVALAIGDSADKNMLAEFTDNKEAVITTHTPERLKKLVRKVRLTTGNIFGDFGFVDSRTQSKQDALIDEIKEIQQIAPDLSQTSTSGDDW